MTHFLFQMFARTTKVQSLLEKTCKADQSNSSTFSGGQSKAYSSAFSNRKAWNFWSNPVSWGHTTLSKWWWLSSEYWFVQCTWCWLFVSWCFWNWRSFKTWSVLFLELITIFRIDNTKGQGLKSSNPPEYNNFCFVRLNLKWVLFYFVHFWQDQRIQYALLSLSQHTKGVPRVALLGITKVSFVNPLHLFLIIQ